MASLAELKAQSPAYANIPDEKFARMVYDKHYAGKMDFASFAGKIGLRAAPADFSGVTSRAESFSSAPKMLSQETAQTVGYHPGMGAIDSGAPAFNPAEAQAATLANQRQDFAGMSAPVRAAVGAGSRVNAMARGVGQVLGVASEDDELAARQADSFMDGDAAASVGKISADLGMMALPASRIGSGGRLARYGQQALLGGAYGGLNPISTGESRGVNAAVGAALNMGGQGLSDAVAAGGKRAASAIAPELRALYEAAKQKGIQLTPAQLTDSRALKFLESSVRSLPLNGLGGKAAKQKAQFNRAVARTIGEDADAVTPEVFARAKSRIGSQFNKLSAKNALPVDDNLLARLVEIQQEASQLGDEATGKAVSNVIGRIMDQTKDGVLPGRAYQSLDSNIGMFMRSGSGEKTHYLGKLRETLRESMDNAVSAEDQAAWQTARQQYRDLMTIQDLVGKGEVGAGISPQGLMGRTMANSAGKKSMATGSRGQLGELARIGQRIKEPQSSGTAERLWLLGTGAGFMANPPAAAGLLAGGHIAGRALNSGLLADYLMSAGRGQGRQVLAPYLRGAGAPLFPILAPQQEADYTR